MGAFTEKQSHSDAFRTCASSARLAPAILRLPKWGVGERRWVLPNAKRASYCKRGSVVSAILEWGDSMKRQFGEQCEVGMAMTLGGVGLCVIGEDFVLGGAERVGVTPSRTRLTVAGRLHAEVQFKGAMPRVSCSQSQITQTAVSATYASTNIRFERKWSRGRIEYEVSRLTDPTTCATASLCSLVGRS